MYPKTYAIKNKTKIKRYIGISRTYGKGKKFIGTTCLLQIAKGIKNKTKINKKKTL